MIDYELLKQLEQRCPGGRLPSSYVILDLETTGLDPWHDRGLQYGVCIVKNDEVVDTWAVIVKYPFEVVCSPKALETHKITPERIKAEGIAASDFFPEFSNFLKHTQSSGTMFMGHNIGAFDRWIIENSTQEFAKAFRFGDNGFIDTGGLVKASQLEGVEFQQHDTLASFFERVREIRAKGVRWSLSWCVERFGLDKSAEINTEKLHDAGRDVVAVHHLYQEMKKRLQGIQKC